MEEKLRKALEEAKEKGQIGLLIWQDQEIWDLFSPSINPNSQYFYFALEQIKVGKEGLLNIEWKGYSVSYILTIPVQKLLTSESFFKYIVDVCKRAEYKGPITLLPSNEVINV